MPADIQNIQRIRETESVSLAPVVPGRIAFLAPCLRRQASGRIGMLQPVAAEIASRRMADMAAEDAHQRAAEASACSARRKPKFLDL